MDTSKKYFINKIIQSGIYYFQLSENSKTRPYLIISKDDGYGSDVLAFQITERFTSSRVNLPIVINGAISFIRISGAKEVSKTKIIDSSFDGLLRPDIFTIATRMYMRRFANVNEEELQSDLEKYLKELNNLHISFYMNRDKFFNKEDYINDCIEDEVDAKIVLTYPALETSTKTTVRTDSEMKKDIIENWSRNLLIKFQNDMRIKSNSELQEIFECDIVVVSYLKRNIRNLIKSKSQEYVYSDNKKKQRRYKNSYERKKN